jgi:hypothetical protein
VRASQVKAMWGGIGVLVLVLAFPPWKFTLSAGTLRVERPGPYGFVSSPPEVPFDKNPLDEIILQAGDLGEANFQGHKRKLWTVQIDIFRLTLPVALIVLATAGALVGLRPRRNLQG